VTSLEFCRAPFFFIIVFFLYVGFLVMTFSWDFLHPPFAYIKICIYNARVPSRMRNQVSIKLILFFEVWIWLIISI
jgi:hypothetical protein